MATPLMMSVLTIVKNREAHLLNLIAGLQRSSRLPDEFIVVDMSDVPIGEIRTPFQSRVIQVAVDGLHLSRARNVAAANARNDQLLFLDVDCVPSLTLLEAMNDALAQHDALICADTRYLAAREDRDWSDRALIASSEMHPVRTFPAHGFRLETNPGLFWSLAFGIRRNAFEALSGFDDEFVGYGGEDTDFGYRAAEQGLPLMFMGGAYAFHQHHGVIDPPLHHFHDIIRNAQLFYAKWGVWPMRDWLDAFVELRLIERSSDALKLLRVPTLDEIRQAVDVTGRKF
ncbi:glycosyltransferase family 2 protein [Variibacter gotjawalensis]|nr:glycosyltransferase [Variibacter gotjawalensis]NIK47702.1 GT2 family glycosyltransferase [Variibacter gotjawalensis]